MNKEFCSEILMRKDKLVNLTCIAEQWTRYLIHNYKCATWVPWRNYVNMVIKFWFP